MVQREVAHLLTRIEQEYASARRGWRALASGTARHAFISGKMERIGTCYLALCGLLDEQEATRAVAERWDGSEGRRRHGEPTAVLTRRCSLYWSM